MFSSLTIGGLAKALGPLLIGAVPARRFEPMKRIEPIVDLPVADPMPAPCEIADPARLGAGRRLIDASPREFAAARLLGRHQRTLAMPLGPQEAARRFVAWMQERGHCGVRLWSGGDGIWAFYKWHCEEDDLQPLPDQVLANALETLCPKRQIRDRSSGTMRRLAAYDIAPAAARDTRKSKRRQPPGKPPKLQERPLARAA